MKKIIVANWKMNLSYSDSLKLAKEYSLSQSIRKTKSELVVCPDYLALPVVSGLIKGAGLKLGAQDCASTLSGAQTGEVSARDLKSLGAKYVIIGHSERRHGLHENSILAAAKIKSALAAGLIPILCVGETAQIKAEGQTRRYLAQELRHSLKGLDNKAKIIIAYEPVWAISTAKSARPLEPKEADSIHSYLETLSAKILGQAMPVLYGGSVNPANADSFLSQPHINGLLVGSASLRLVDFEAIC